MAKVVPAKREENEMYLKKNTKRVTAAILSVMLGLTLAACGSGSDTAAVDNTQTEAENKDAAAVESEAPAKEDVATEQASEDSGSADDGSETTRSEMMTEDACDPVYRDQVKEMVSSGTADQFMLVYIDDDEIPELLASNSEGPLDKENAFIYTFYNDELVLLASVISGADGGSLSYSENNMIRQTGSVAGMSDVYSKLADGKLEEELRAEMIDTLKTDSEGEEVYKYSVNGKDATEKEYNDSIDGLVKEYTPFISIDYDGLNVITYKDGAYEQTQTRPYCSAEEMLVLLGDPDAE